MQFNHGEGSINTFIQLLLCNKEHLKQYLGCTKVPKKRCRRFTYLLFLVLSQRPVCCLQHDPGSCWLSALYPILCLRNIPMQVLSSLWLISTFFNTATGSLIFPVSSFKQLIILARSKMSGWLIWNKSVVARWFPKQWDSWLLKSVCFGHLQDPD